MIYQPRKYLEKLYVNVNTLFKDQLPRDLQSSIKIIKLLITIGNLNLIHNETTYEHLNHLSRKRKLDKLYNQVQILMLSNTSQLIVEYVR